MTPARDDSDIETVTFRLPSSLKRALDAAAELRGETSTAVLRGALESELGGGARRAFIPAGLTPAFDSFWDGIETAAKKPGQVPILLLVEIRGQRYIFDGSASMNHSGAGVVGLKKGSRFFVLPKAYIVGWHSGPAAALNMLCIALTKAGWMGATPGYDA